MEFKVGVKSVANYTRMAYSLEYALAELVDNSIQAYLDEEKQMKSVYKKTGERFAVWIDYDMAERTLSVTDNSTGISRKKLELAMNIGGDMDRNNPNESLGEFNVGMKAASIWLSEIFEIYTKRYDEDHETVVTVDTEKLFGGDSELEEKSRKATSKNLEKGYTRIEYLGLRHKFSTHQIKKAKYMIASIYRKYLNKKVDIYFKEEKLFFDDWVLHINPNDGKEYKWEIPKGYIPHIKQEVSGWIGILKVDAPPEEKSRASGPTNAGIAILRRNRVILGQPKAWFPSTIFGDTRAGLTNQRIVGEIVFNSAIVSQTKDAIAPAHLDIMEKFLAQLAKDSEIKKIANWIRKKKYRIEKSESEEALENVEKRITESDLDKRQTTSIPPIEAISSTNKIVFDNINKDNKITYRLRNFIIHLYPEHHGDDTPFLVYRKESTTNEISMAVNLDHPYLLNNWTGLESYYTFIIMLGLTRYKIENNKRLTMDDFFDQLDEMMRFEIIPD